MSPALQLLERGHQPVRLAEVIGAVLRYRDPGDKEAAELQEMVCSLGERRALSQCASLPEDHPLVELAIEKSTSV